jgi:transposase
VCDGAGRPLVLLLSEGQMNDHKGAALLIDHLPPAQDLLGDAGYDSDAYRAALQHRGITPCIPSRKNRKVAHPHDKTLYRSRHHVENMFAKLKDWRRIAMRYDRCADLFMAAIVVAAIVIFWLKL